MPYKDGDANVRSVWLCSRNDAIGNVVVMAAALGVWGTSSAWPDLAVARAHGRHLPHLIGANPAAGLERISLRENATLLRLPWGDR